MKRTLLAIAACVIIAGCASSDGPSATSYPAYPVFPAAPNFPSPTAAGPSRPITNKGIVRAIRGDCQSSPDNGATWVKPRVGQQVRPGDFVRTARGSSIDLYLGENGPIVRLPEESFLVIQNLDLENTGQEKVIRTELDLRKGRLLFNVKKLAAASVYKVTTPVCAVVAQGGEYSISDTGVVSVVSGDCFVTYRIANTLLAPVNVKTGQQVIPPVGPDEQPRISKVNEVTVGEATMLSALTTTDTQSRFTTRSEGAGDVATAKTEGLSDRFFDESNTRVGVSPSRGAFPLLGNPSARDRVSLEAKGKLVEINKPGSSPTDAREVRFETLKRRTKQSPVFYSKSEEIWIISRPTLVANVGDDQYPRAGTLLTKLKDSEVPLPLKHTDVKAKILGYIATVDVTQQFHNPYDSKIEAVYVFPLPENSAVNEFVMKIGERQIRGIIREREEARQIYESARSQGYVASLMTQERPNIFTQSVANIEPGKQIDVSITYYNTLSYMDGWFEFVFPMVVGPRFNPPGAKASPEPGYLKPHQSSAHRVSLEVDLEAGVAIEQFESPAHKISTTRPAANKLVARLAEEDRIPNRDFVLRYQVSGDEIKSGMLTHKDKRGGFFTMMVYPPEIISKTPRQPMEMVFVLDCSGSMSGRPLEQAKNAIRAAMKLLKPQDSFQIINFSLTASQLGRDPLDATPENIQRGLRYLTELNAEGGTMMIEGIKAALEFKHDPERLRYVSFLTDGYIGNESEILEAIQRRLGPARIFSFGVGSSVNRYLLDSMARVGRGAVAYLLPETESAPVMSDFFERISHPALTDLKIDWAGMNVREIYPKTLPDLYAGRPILLSGRFDGEAPSFVKVTTKNSEAEIAVPIFRQSEAPALASIWARSKIADLSLRASGEVASEIKKTALDFSLLSDFTAFVAVDSTQRTNGAEGTTVPVSVPTPEGVKYNTTVSR